MTGRAAELWHKVEAARLDALACGRLVVAAVFPGSRAAEAS
jgi:hypothetical protein